MLLVITVAVAEPLTFKERRLDNNELTNGTSR